MPSYNLYNFHKINYSQKVDQVARYGLNVSNGTVVRATSSLPRTLQIVDLSTTNFHSYEFQNSALKSDVIFSKKS